MACSPFDNENKIFKSCTDYGTFSLLFSLLFQCTGPSMEPTIFTNNIIFTEHLTPRFRKIERGDIIIAKCPTNPKQYICKRVVGLPGDHMKIDITDTEIVPRGHVWLEGDNKTNSADSRVYGPVPQGLIRSRALFRIWPFNDIRMLNDKEKC